MRITKRPKLENMDDFYRMEWRDADKILKMSKRELLWQIWNERSNKLLFLLSGLLIGLIGGILFA